MLMAHLLISAPTFLAGALITYFTLFYKKEKIVKSLFMLLVRFILSYFLSLGLWSLSCPLDNCTVVFSTPAIVSEALLFVILIVISYYRREKGDAIEK